MKPDMDVERKVALLMDLAIHDQDATPGRPSHSQRDCATPAMSARFAR